MQKGSIYIAVGDRQYCNLGEIVFQIRRFWFAIWANLVSNFAQIVFPYHTIGSEIPFIF